MVEPEERGHLCAYRGTLPEIVASCERDGSLLLSPRQEILLRYQGHLDYDNVAPFAMERFWPEAFTRGYVLIRDENPGRVAYCCDGGPDDNLLLDEVGSVYDATRIHGTNEDGSPSLTHRSDGERSYFLPETNCRVVSAISASQRQMRFFPMPTEDRTWPIYAQADDFPFHGPLEALLGSRSATMRWLQHGRLGSSIPSSNRISLRVSHPAIPAPVPKPGHVELRPVVIGSDAFQPGVILLEYGRTLFGEAHAIGPR